MKLRTVQWNIGGGKVLQNNESSPNFGAYSEDGLEDIIDFLKQTDPDIVTLQEVHKNNRLNQAEYIAQKSGMNYCVSDFYADSHVEAGQKLGHAIISKYLITDEAFELFLNLGKEIVMNGEVWVMHDKGYTRCSVDINGTPLEVTTLHLPPLRKYDIAIDSPDGKRLLSDVQIKLGSSASRQLIQADFNLDKSLLAPVLPDLMKDKLDEAPQLEPTSPRGRHYDHVLFKNMTLIESEVDCDVLTDHYPLVSVFEL